MRMKKNSYTSLEASTSLNVDLNVVDDFGREWSTFNQSALSAEDLAIMFDQYFAIFPFDKIDGSSVGFDMGCGSGRWAKLMAPKVGSLICIEPSELALEQAKKNLKELTNIEYECASVSETKVANSSQDFGYSLGVLHHVPDTLSGIKSCSKLLKSGAPFLIYLYYRFDNKPIWFRIVWRISNLIRLLVCNLPYLLKLSVTQIIALFVYWPLARIALLLESFGFNVENIPLSEYRKRSFYTLRTDALDRFGTKLEKRFTKKEIEHMLSQAGFHDIRFSQQTPFWVAVAIKK